MSDKTIIKKMRESGIPDYTFKTTLAKEGQDALREIIATKGYETEDGFERYMLHAGDRSYGADVARTVALMAKELVLNGVPTYHTTVTALAREIKYEYQRTDESPILARRGKGFITVAGFGDIEVLEASAWMDTLDWLMSHAYSGGGLVLGQAIWVAAIESVYGEAFAAFARSLREIRIKV